MKVTAEQFFSNEIPSDWVIVGGNLIVPEKKTGDRFSIICYLYYYHSVQFEKIATGAGIAALRPKVRPYEFIEYSDSVAAELLISI